MFGSIWAAALVGERRGMTDLRRDCIEAGARAMYVADGGRPEIWDNIGDELRRAYREKFRSPFDAVVSVLSERADEWWVESAERRAVDCRVEHWVVEPEALLAVLRGDEEDR